MALKNFLTNLQNSSPARKFRWLVVLSAVSVAIVIGLWILYTSSVTPSEAPFVRKDARPTFFQKVSISVHAVVDTLRRKTANMIYYFQTKFGATNTFDLKSQPSTSTSTP